MAKNSTNNKAKTNSSNGCKTSPKVGKSVYRDSTTGRFTGQTKSEKSMSEADKLTLRAWKKTFENQKKAA